MANIKHKKEKNDAKKGKIFTIIGREIVMAVKAGGPDPNNNSKLRDVIAKAKVQTVLSSFIYRLSASLSVSFDASDFILMKSIIIMPEIFLSRSCLAISFAASILVFNMLLLPEVRDFVSHLFTCNI